MMKLVRTLAKVLLTLTCNTVTAAAHTEKDTLLIDDRTETCDTVPDSLALAAKPRANIYDLPYSTRTSCPDWKRLWLNTGVLFAGGVATLGVLQLLPENATAWNKERITSIPFWKRWSYHVSRGPVWDGDNFRLVPVLHGHIHRFLGVRDRGFHGKAVDTGPHIDSAVGSPVGRGVL